MATETERCDVLILGGGLAGLTLALQLKQRFPALAIELIERRRHPVPEAAFKVGESTVELGAHYFAEVLGLKPHLEQQQIRKFGFRFFFSDGRRDLDAVTEIGVRRPLAVPSWQIDRGIFENFLATEVQARGMRFHDGARVTKLQLDDRGDAAHRVQWRQGEAERTTEARWLIDASGRAGLVKRQLGLVQDNEHHCHAVWFRVAHRIPVDDWGRAAWRAECTPPERWRSTNHLVGAGYWVWLIPLASGSHSVGIVADPRHHPLDRMDTFDKAMDWLREHQPRLFDELDPRRDTLQDFAFFRKFSYGCRQVFSGRRWALTGEAGLFLDPFYSPGSDFIAIANTLITELVAMDQAGQPLGAHAHLYDQLFHSFYDNTLSLYQDQYALFGRPEVLPVKVLWDYTYYWGLLCQLFVQQRIADLKLMSGLREELGLCQRLNREVQALLRAWGAAAPADANPPRLLDQSDLPWFAALNASLNDGRLDDAALRQRLRDNTWLLRELAAEIADRVAAQQPQLDPSALRALAGPLPAGAMPRLFPAAAQAASVALANTA